MPDPIAQLAAAVKTFTMRSIADAPGDHMLEMIEAIETYIATCDERACECVPAWVYSFRDGDTDSAAFMTSMTAAASHYTHHDTVTVYAMCIHALNRRGALHVAGDDGDGIGRAYEMALGLLLVPLVIDRTV